jgi:hypothetical protein
MESFFDKYLPSSLAFATRHLRDSVPLSVPNKVRNNPPPKDQHRTLGLVLL